MNIFCERCGDKVDAQIVYGVTMGIHCDSGKKYWRCPHCGEAVHTKSDNVTPAGVIQGRETRQFVDGIIYLRKRLSTPVTDIQQRLEEFCDVDEFSARQIRTRGQARTVYRHLATLADQHGIHDMRMARRKARMSLRRLSEETGIGEQTLKEYERGRSGQNPPPEVMQFLRDCASAN